MVRNTEAHVLIWAAASLFKLNKAQLIWSELADTTANPAEAQVKFTVQNSISTQDYIASL